MVQIRQYLDFLGRRFFWRGHKRKHFLLFVRGLGFDIPGQALVDLLEQKLQLFASLPDRVDRAPGAMDIE